MDLNAIRDQLRSVPQIGKQPSPIEPQKPLHRQPSQWRRMLRLLMVGIVVVPMAAMMCFYIASVLRESQTAEQLAPSRGRFIQTSQGRLFIQEKGPPQGIPVLLIHGTAAWSELWRETIDALAAAQFRVIALDVPPFGFSSRPPDRNYTRSAQAERLSALIDALDVGSVILVGHSFGAGPTVETVMKFPDKVRGLVLVDGALGISDPNGPQPPPALLTTLLAKPFIRNPLVASLVTNPWLTQRLVQSMVFRREAVTPERVAILQRPMALRDSTTDLGDWLKYFTSVDSNALSMDRARYKNIQTKTVLIWGDQDTLTPMYQADDIHQLIPNTEILILPGLGHIPQIENPAAFTLALIRALRSFN